MPITADPTFSTRYNEEVRALYEWFMTKLATLPPLSLREGQIAAGIDSIEHPPYRALLTRAHEEWRAERNYDLSYQQVCRAFFPALTDANKLVLVT